ncbi:hypothetical protein BAU15_07450 [Enterococcus sp. JM4C]|uniref:ABC transporter ATP-binding protein n=1 Tax=Candidatus Enterococcus huntleyi TaxID=1857217 RepID=UPI00137A505D|nr:ABC transporter ATP-binding protein [Enterococcus sp. JM4C]KAF1297539.1 hypothetical protein BAU15_07450 [Enterococcus sp. JM4C]
MTKYFKLHKRQFVIYLLVSIVYALILAGTGFVYSLLTDAALGDNFQRFLGVAIFAIIFLIADSYFDFVPRYIRAKLVNNILHSLRSELITHYMEKDLQAIMEEDPTVRTDHLVNQLEVVETSYLKPLLSSIISVFVFGFSLAGAFYLQGTLTLIMLALCFLPFLAPVINQRVLSNKKHIAQTGKKTYLAKFEDFSRNLSTLRLANSSAIFAKLLHKSSRTTAGASVDFEKGQAQTYAISYGLSNIVYSGTWVIGGIFVFKNLLTVPELIAMTTLMGTVAGPIQTVSELTTEFTSSKKVVSEFLATLSETSSSKSSPGKPFNEEITELTLMHVNYRRKKQVIFNELSYTFQMGNKYAIIGESGAGKSTLLQLLMGILTPEEGTIRLNGEALTDFDKASYYRHFSYVPQRTAIFSGTIAENVSLFQEINEDKVREALHKAGLKNWLASQEEGLRTNLTANRLSGGEERRLDIARALYREAEMIILDEPTSGLDQKNEQLISEVIASLTDKLVIVVTHSTQPDFLASFDQVIQLKNKQIVQQSLAN